MPDLRRLTQIDILLVVSLMGCLTDEYNRQPELTGAPDNARDQFRPKSKAPIDSDARFSCGPTLAPGAVRRAADFKCRAEGIDL